MLVYADGALVRQQLVTEADGWQYRFEMPKYDAAGKEIIYTIDEAATDGYDKAVDGYDLINTYREDTPGESEDPGVTPPTGDTARIWPWLILTLLSGAALLCFGRRKRYAERRRYEE